MTKLSLTRGLALLVIGLLGIGLGGCGKNDAGKAGSADPTPNGDPPDNRGVFIAGACPSGDRIALPTGAVYAAYFDSAGEQLVPPEVLAGTQDTKMCPFTAEEDTPDPGICTPLCSLTLGKRTYCVPCP